MNGEGSNANETGGQDRAPPVHECTFSNFMKCNPTPFHGKEGAIELCQWFEKFEMVFSISDCAERNKVKFAAATLKEEFCPDEEVQRLEDELRSLKLRDINIASYTQRLGNFSLSPIPNKDSDPLMEEIDLFINPNDPMPPGIKEDDDDSERDTPILEELLDNYSLSLPTNESYHFDIPSPYRPPAKPPDGNTGTLNIKMMGDVSD
nr:hypothetical protein [Tanacetum cinerariifolium]